MGREKQLRIGLNEIRKMFHRKLRAENLSLRKDGHSDIYYSGVRDGKIEAYSEMLYELDPYYSLLKDYPEPCANPVCEEFVFPAWNGKKYHDIPCREKHYQEMRSTKTGLFLPSRRVRRPQKVKGWRLKEWLRENPE